MILIGMIVVLFLISSLVVAMMSQSTSTAFSLSFENSANRSYYLAESGFRYAVARIKHGADMKADLHLHTPAFSLANGAGSFDLSLFPHYLEKTIGTISPGTDLNGIDVPGGYDSGSSDALAFPGGAVKKVRIVAPDGTWDKIHDYNLASVNPTLDVTPGKHTATVTFTGISPAISQTLPSGTLILPVAEVDGNQATVGNDDGSGGTVALDIKTGSTDAFPQYNGTFRVKDEPTLYAYQKKEGDTLTGITTPLDPTLSPPFSFGDGDSIVLERFVRIKSTGTYRNASRMLTYHLPLATPEATVKLEDDFQSLSNWKTEGSAGTFKREEISGDKAMMVDTVSTTSVAAGKVAQIQIKTDTAIGKSLQDAWQYGNKGYLGYDAQVKVGFDTTTAAPADGTTSFGNPAANIPNYYMSGLNFRVSDITSSAEKKSYGLSFMRGPGPSFPINASLVPVANKHLLVLWQQTGATAADLSWLAYKDMNPVFFSDDMEGASRAAKSLYRGEQEITWNSIGSWATTTSDSNSPSTCWHDSPGGDYSNNLRIYIYTNDLDLSGTSKATLSFWHHYDIEKNYDWAAVYISRNGSSFTRISDYYDGLQSSWIQEEIEISSYLPSTQIRILFYLYTDFSIRKDGWYIDDVAIRKEVPIHESTLVTRTHEAPVVVFKESWDADGRGIKDGDLIYEEGGRLSGIVDGPPVVTIGDWTSASKASGLLSLRGVNYDETKSGTSLKVIGAATIATMVSYSGRENLVRAFIGDTTGEGTANAAATDFLKTAHPRGTIKWPPDEVSNWSASQDYFSLVQWDGVNSGSTAWQDWSSVEAGAAITADSFSLISPTGEADSVIRTNALVSPDKDSTYSQAELGLHAFGDGAQSTYFDDFSVKMNIGAQYEYPPVVQE